MPSQSLLLITLDLTVSGYLVNQIYNEIDFIVSRRFRTIAKGEVSFSYLSFDLSVPLKQLDSNWTIFYEVLCWKIDSKPVEEIQV
jgi:hypothetical protein